MEVECHIAVGRAERNGNAGQSLPEFDSIEFSFLAAHPANGSPIHCAIFGRNSIRPDEVHPIPGADEVNFYEVSIAREKLLALLYISLPAWARHFIRGAQEFNGCNDFAAAALDDLDEVLDDRVIIQLQEERFSHGDAGIGCLRGLQTRAGASAVGDSATRAVVTGIILLVVVDGLFAVAYYLLNI